MVSLWPRISYPLWITYPYFLFHLHFLQFCVLHICFVTHFLSQNPDEASPLLQVLLPAYFIPTPTSFPSCTSFSRTSLPSYILSKCFVPHFPSQNPVEALPQLQVPPPAYFPFPVPFPPILPCNVDTLIVFFIYIVCKCIFMLFAFLKTCLFLVFLKFYLLTLSWPYLFVFYTCLCLDLWNYVCVLGIWCIRCACLHFRSSLAWYFKGVLCH